MVSRRIELRGGREFGWDKDTETARDISGTLNALLADFFTLYLKGKEFPLACRRT
jgi:hypothetical protein